MKTKRRVSSISISENRDYLIDDLISSTKHKIRKTNNSHQYKLPLNSLHHRETHAVASWESNMISDGKDMDVDTPLKIDVGMRLLFFLGLNGKERVDEILGMIPTDNEKITFVSSHFPKKLQGVNYLTDKECTFLASYFKVLDPLGGGQYPLDYLIVLDQDMRIRSKFPIRMNSRYESHEKFGLDFYKLHHAIEWCSAYHRYT